jgi:hypothetical protein
MITSRIVQESGHVFGVYDSNTTYLMIHYVNKGDRDEVDKSTAHVDLETMFGVLEKLDRRKEARRTPNK